MNRCEGSEGATAVRGRPPPIRNVGVNTVGSPRRTHANPLDRE